jgi:hypothetical protein
MKRTSTVRFISLFTIFDGIKAAKVYRGTQSTFTTDFSAKNNRLPD